MKGVFSKSAGIMELTPNAELAAEIESAPPPAAEYYSWEIAGKPVAVRIDYDVIDRLLREVQRGFGLVPRRGVEMGGILIGCFDPAPDRPGEWLVKVVDFEGVPCSHSKGMAYQLTDEEEERFGEVLERWRRTTGKQTYAVGYYRSHTREGLAMAPEDVELFDRCFPEPGAITLLVKPFATRLSVGALFFRENGYMRTESSYLEFPFRRSELGGGEPEAAPVREEPAAATPLQEAPDPKLFRIPDEKEFAPPTPMPRADQMPPPQPPPLNFTPQPPAAPLATATPKNVLGIPGSRRDPGTGKRIRSGWVWIPLSFVFLLFGAALGFMFAVNLRPGSTASANQDPLALGLTVSREGDSLHVRWERGALGIQGVGSGTLTIDDGGARKVVNLDAAQLRNGSVIYRRATDDVQFKLEVHARERTFLSEAVAYRGGEAPPR